ncbi:hypothetical protein SDC9_87286 [bioreactor metagenome]|uniref:Uncharacterized protein n=1 Tax=bioreactor metagenome TaxID=1076179 RepID=A0A644ZIC4_9ZZZZ
MWESRLYCGSEKPKGGWVSYGYPVREPIGQVQEVFSSAVPLTMVTVIAGTALDVAMTLCGQHFEVQIESSRFAGDMDGVEVQQ